MQLYKTNDIDNAAYTYRPTTDFLGATSSTLCMIHCLITPLLFAVQATSLSCSEISPFWWKMFDGVFLIVSLVAIIYTAKSTSLKYMSNLMYISWAFLAFIVINDLFHLISIPHMLIYIPAMTLVILHLYNRKYCRCAKDSCCA